MSRPPFETFLRPTCRGSYALHNACDHCERCTWERQQMVGVDLSKDALADQVDRERYQDDPEKARMRAALEAIRELIRNTGGEQWRNYAGLTEIDQLARQGLAP